MITEISTKSVPSLLIKLLYLVIVVRVSSKRRARPGLAITHALNTITSPITISYRKASSSVMQHFLTPSQSERATATTLFRPEETKAGHDFVKMAVKWFFFLLWLIWQTDRRMLSSKSFGEGLDLLSPTSMRGSNSNLGKSVDGSLNIKSDEYRIKKPTSLPLMLVGDTRTTNSSLSDFFDDPLLILRQHAWSGIHQNITKERRLAAVMCLLVVVFLICYLPFWTVFLCLVSEVLIVTYNINSNF